MEVLEFYKTQERMCKSYKETYPACDGCPLSGDYCKLGVSKDETVNKKIVETVEEWAKGNPVKTRQSEFLKIVPDAKIGDDGYLRTAPCNVIAISCDYTTTCEECRKKFWGQEI